MYPKEIRKVVGFAKLSAVGAGAWVETDGGLLSAQASLAGAATSVTVQLEFSNDGVEAVAGATYTLSQTTKSDGTTFTSPGNNFAFVRLRISAMTGTGTVTGTMRYREQN